ncbi:MAG: LPP20 family lipoprotein [Pseudomonadota bacterium]
MNKCSQTLIVCCVLGLLGCAPAVKQEAGSAIPAWVNGASEQYPLALYIVGRGVGASQEEAKDRARADIAKTFAVAVFERSQDQQNYVRTERDGQSQQQLEQTVSRNIMTRTDKLLHGAEIADVWADETGSRAYALAVLSRAKAAEQLRQEIADLDAATEQYIQRSGAEPSGLIKVAFAHQAVIAQQERIGLQRSLRVVDQTGAGLPPKWSLAQLALDRDELIRRVRIYPAHEGLYVAGLVDVLNGSLGAAGFTVASATIAEYRLRAEVELDDPLYQDGWYWIRGALELNLTDRDGKPLGVQRWPLKVSATEEDRARGRVLDAIESLLKRDLRSTVLEFAMAKQAAQETDGHDRTQ